MASSKGGFRLPSEPLPPFSEPRSNYGLYHVGYGMGLEEALFLAGLGIVYALAYLTAENVLVLWPLMTPLGAWFSQLESGELFGRLPWASLLGFADVLAVMAGIIWLARRHERKLDRAPA